MLKKILILSFLLFFPVIAMAHSGGTDSKGGHYCYTGCELYGLKTGEYHYHDTTGNPLFTWDNNSKLYNRSMADRVSGQILLQVENHGEAWYINTENKFRYYMKDGAAAYYMMRYFSLGITDSDLEKIPLVENTTVMNATTSLCKQNAFSNQLKGKILLQVEQHGEAWYVDPVKCRRIYMKDGAVAYEIMRFLGLGITNVDLAQIPVGLIEVDKVSEAVESEVPTVTVDTVIADHCKSEWPNDLQMEGYCRDQQYDGVATLNLGKPTDIGESEFSVIRTECEREWPTDYNMRAYCEEQQFDGVRDLAWGKPVDITESEFNIIRPECAKDWATDYNMRAYCEDQQYDAVRTLNATIIASAIRTSCANQWPMDFNMRVYCEEQSY